MRISLRTVVWLFCIGSLGSGAESGAGQLSGGGGSMVPCSVPMVWTVASADPRFGLERDDALAALRRAAGLWEEALDVDLFEVRGGGPDASPVSFEYDDRQATLDVRRRLRAELDSVRAEVERRRSLLEAESSRFDSARSAYEGDAQAHRRAMTAYNATVTEWNERGGAPPEVRAELESRLAELNRIRETLREREAELARVSDWLQAEVQELNRRIVDVQRREERFVRDFSLSAAESGRYDETVTWEG
ncbi:MAG: hypothetical protein R3253_15900, partial [Longimicrobiales bacterium]|nr:hypothetical protein [Longimicrobiales bacterium]